MNTSTLIPFIYPVALILVIAILGSLLKKRPSKKVYQYKNKTFLMSKTEREFYKILEDILQGEYYIFPQIQITSLFSHKIKGQNWTGAHNHIKAKSVDYVLCDKNNLSTKLAIELDDSSHSKKNRIERDEEIERIFQEGALPLLRIPVSKISDREFVRQELIKILS